MAQPNVSHSVTIRVELNNTPGSLGRLTTAIGEAGGNILGIDLIEAQSEQIVRDITVLAADPDPQYSGKPFWRIELTKVMPFIW